MRCRVSCAGRAGRLLMSTVCVYLYAVAHLQLELLGLVFLDSCLVALEGERKETLSSCFATCPMEFDRGVGKAARGMSKEGMLGEDRGLRVESWERSLLER